MKHISRSSAHQRLAAVRAEFREQIAAFEDRAEPCSACLTPGACCLDAHFVNVRVSRLEGEAIRAAIGELSPEQQLAIRQRAAKTIETYKLDEVIDFGHATYPCPLFEKGIGCVVHDSAKPLPCIAHACYRRVSDLPPDDLLDAAEQNVDALNRLAYGKGTLLVPIPLTILAT